MSYTIKIILECEEKPTPKDIIHYINELGEDIDYEIKEKKNVKKDKPYCKTITPSTISQ